MLTRTVSTLTLHQRVNESYSVSLPLTTHNPGQTHLHQKYPRIQDPTHTTHIPHITLSSYLSISNTFATPIIHTDILPSPIQSYITTFASPINCVQFTNIEVYTSLPLNTHTHTLTRSGHDTSNNRTYIHLYPIIVIHTLYVFESYKLETYIPLYAI